MCVGFCVPRTLLSLRRMTYYAKSACHYRGQSSARLARLNSSSIGFSIGEHPRAIMTRTHRAYAAHYRIRGTLLYVQPPGSDVQRRPTTDRGAQQRWNVRSRVLALASGARARAHTRTAERGMPAGAFHLPRCAWISPCEPCEPATATHGIVPMSAHVVGVVVAAVRGGGGGCGGDTCTCVCMCAQVLEICDCSPALPLRGAMITIKSARSPAVYIRV